MGGHRRPLRARPKRQVNPFAAGLAARGRLTFRRALRAPEFWLLVTATLAAAGGVPWQVVVPLTLAGLSIASLPKYAALWPRARRAGAGREWLVTVCLSMFNNLATACAAFLLGIAVRWFWE
jgi:hypothetical protein